jgi:steroid delta-isomerase-like uncharacterized protein
MASRNVESFRLAHESFNRRDFDGVLKVVVEDYTYNDHPTGNILKGRNQFREFLQGWADGFSDGKIVNAEYLDAGDTVVAQFTFEGTNDGRFLGMSPTGRRVSLPVCEIARYDSQGQVASAALYYDQVTIGTQLGMMKPLATAA